MPVDANAPAPVGAGAEPLRLDVGHLIHEAFEAAEDIKRPYVGAVVDPETGAQVPYVATGGGGFEILDPAKLDRWRGAPVRLRGLAVLSRLDSLIDHANRFKGPQSALFADDDPNLPSLSAVLDYSEPGAPRWGRHMGRYAFPLDPGWAAWRQVDGRWLDVIDCAQFVEDHLPDIAQVEEGDDMDESTRRLISAGGYSNIAGPSRMLELSRGFAVHENSTVSEVRRLATGEAQVIFTSEHLDASGAPLKIPNLFMLALPVFRYGAIARLAVRFRYVKQGGLKLRFDLWRPDLVFDRAFYDAVQRAAVETSLPLFYGHPEQMV